MFVDGFDFAGHTMVGALGVTSDGTKVPLGVVEGSTENATVVRHLVTGLRDRGLDASEGVLFVLDGGKALKTAVTNVFGAHAVIARCRTHKERNVMDHLTEAERPWVRRKLRAAWANPHADEGEAALKALAAQLERMNPDAAASLREGLTGLRPRPTRRCSRRVHVGGARGRAGAKSPWARGLRPSALLCEVVIPRLEPPVAVGGR